MRIVARKFSAAQARRFALGIRQYFEEHPKRWIYNLKTKSGKVRVRKSHIEADLMRHAHGFGPNR